MFFFSSQNCSLYPQIYLLQMIIYVEHVYCLTNNKSKKMCAHSARVIVKWLVVVAAAVDAAVAFCYFANGNDDGVTVNVFSVYGSASCSRSFPFTLYLVHACLSCVQTKFFFFFLLVHGNKTWRKAPRMRWNTNNSNNNRNNTQLNRRKETKDTKANAGKYHT